MRIDSILYKGFVNKELRVTYNYNFEPSGQYQTIVQRDNGNVKINPGFGISISEGYEKSRIYLPANKYYSFTTLLHKSVKLISDNLYEIFPNINKMEFETDSRVLERFQTEQALSTHDITMIPAVWTDETGACYAGLRVNMVNGTVTIPLEDAIPLSAMLKSFEPNIFGLSILRIIGKID